METLRDSASLLRDVADRLERAIKNGSDDDSLKHSTNEFLSRTRPKLRHHPCCWTEMIEPLSQSAEAIGDLASWLRGWAQVIESSIAGPE